MSLGTLFPEDIQPNNARGNNVPNDNDCDDDFPEGDEIMSPNHLLSTLANNNPWLLNIPCKDDNDHKEVTPGVQNMRYDYKDQKNNYERSV